MAVTSIWPIKNRVDRVINYARNPEKTHEESHEYMSGFHAVNDVVEYAANEIKTERRSYVTGINCREDCAVEQFMDTKKYWKKTDGRACFHAYQSFKADEVTADMAHQIGVETALKMWGDDFEVLVCTHCNTGHYHNHFVINSVSWRDGHHFDNRRSDYVELMKISDSLCRKYRISVIEESSGRGKNYGEYLAEKNGKPTIRQMIRNDIDRAIAASMTEREFVEELKSIGYEVRLQGSKGQEIKSVGLKPLGSPHFFRFSKLGDGYSLEAINERILDHVRRNLPFPDEEKRKLADYRKATKPKVKLKGLKALYIHYCYELHIIEKFPASVKRVSLFMREDLSKLDDLDRQSRFLAENNIDSYDELKAFKEAGNSKLELLKAERNDLRNELKRVNRDGNTVRGVEIKERILAISGEMKEIRKGLRTCEAIERRSEEREQVLLEIQKEQSLTERKEETEAELLRRSGRTGRENVT